MGSSNGVNAGVHRIYFSMDGHKAFNHTYMTASFLTLNVCGLSYFVQLREYHGCWCPGSFCRQDIISHDIDYIE